MSYQAWLQQADDDLDAADALSKIGHHSQAAWLAAQAVEKAHKAILVALGLRYEDKHFKQLGHNTTEIARVLPASLQEPLNPRLASMIATLETRASASRYPAPAQTPGRGPVQIVAPAASMSNSEQDVAEAREVLSWCRDRIARAVRAEQAMRPSSPQSPLP